MNEDLHCSLLGYDTVYCSRQNSLSELNSDKNNIHHQQKN